MSSNKTLEVLDQLGRGLSVNTICTRLQLTYDELCYLATEDLTLYNELKKWYPLYDFTVKEMGQTSSQKTTSNPTAPTISDKPLETKEKTKQKKGTYNRRSPKKVEEK